MTNEREGDGNDKRPEMSFEFSTGYESDDKRRNKREDTSLEEKVADEKKVVQESIYSSFVAQLSTQIVNYLLSSMEELVKYFNSKGFL